MDFPTPLGYIDIYGYTDDNRPEAYFVPFQHPLRGLGKYHWSQESKTWHPAADFLPSPPIYEPQGRKWTTRELLESPPPFTTLPASSRITHQSSHQNQLFASIGRITLWPHSDGLADYYCNQNITVPNHWPIQHDPTLEMNSEAEAIYITRAYIMGPVVRALYYCGISRQVKLIPEDTAIAGNIVSRSDMTVRAEIPGGWRPFAIIEFKRPGAINIQEWEPAMSQNGGALGPGADRICRQLHKYAYTYDTPYVAVCDGLTLVLMLLGGSRLTWYSNQPTPTAPNVALFRWVGDIKHMKCNLYVWLRQAYNAILGT